MSAVNDNQLCTLNNTLKIHVVNIIWIHCLTGIKILYIDVTKPPVKRVFTKTSV